LFAYRLLELLLVVEELTAAKRVAVAFVAKKLVDVASTKFASVTVAFVAKKLVAVALSINAFVV
jgi:hypothetical protein